MKEARISNDFYPLLDPGDYVFYISSDTLFGLEKETWDGLMSGFFSLATPEALCFAIPEDKAINGSGGAWVSPDEIKGSGLKGTGKKIVDSLAQVTRKLGYVGLLGLATFLFSVRYSMTLDGKTTKLRERIELNKRMQINRMTSDVRAQMPVKNEVYSKKSDFFSYWLLAFSEIEASGVELLEISGQKERESGGAEFSTFCTVKLKYHRSEEFISYLELLDLSPYRITARILKHDDRLQTAIILCKSR